MEQVLANCFSESEIQHMLKYAREHFVKLDDAPFNQKSRDDKFDLFWEVIYPKIRDFIPASDYFKIKGGFLNETTAPYKIHTDGARTLDERVMCTVLLPLALSFDDETKYDRMKNRLFIFEQSADLATVFRLNCSEAQLTPYYRYAVTLNDYRDMMSGSTGEAFNNAKILDLCNHLSPEEFFGLSVKLDTTWDIGKCIIFHPHNLHVSTNFTNLGIRSKTNLVYSLLYK